MGRATLALVGGLFLIGIIVWVVWSTTSSPMMLGGFPTPPTAPLGNETPLSIEQAGDTVRAYLARLGDRNLALAEVMAFDNHFYASVKEQDSGLYAFELLIDRFNGQVVFEPGPNMMWNAKYGHMKMDMLNRFFGVGSVDSQMALSANEAQKTAQQFLENVLPGAAARKIDRFYGYYTFHIVRKEKPIGMLSVNGQSGQVWVHSWHGAFLEMRSVGDVE